MRAAVIYEQGSLENIILEDDFGGMDGMRLNLPLVIGSDIAGEVDALGDMRIHSEYGLSAAVFGTDFSGQWKLPIR